MGQIGNETPTDIFQPPDFTVTGIKPFKQAVVDGNWIGAVNVWVVRKTKNGLEVLYQARPDDSYYGAGKLDVSVGGYYEAGEYESGNHFREFQEELGVDIDLKNTYRVTRRLVSLVNQHTGRERRIVLDVYLSELDLKLTDLSPDPEEVAGLAWISLVDLLRLHRKEIEKLEIKGITGDKVATQYTVTRESFPPNFDDYHYAMTQQIYAWSVGALTFPVVTP